jgi:hypothetical protein
LGRDHQFLIGQAFVTQISPLEDELLGSTGVNEQSLLDSTL